MVLRIFRDKIVKIKVAGAVAILASIVIIVGGIVQAAGSKCQVYKRIHICTIVYAYTSTAIYILASIVIIVVGIVRAAGSKCQVYKNVLACTAQIRTHIHAQSKYSSTATFNLASIVIIVGVIGCGACANRLDMICSSTHAQAYAQAHTCMRSYVTRILFFIVSSSFSLC